MKHITTDELKRMTCEGLVLQGCGGNLDEWVTGINEMLTEQGILLNGDTFNDIYFFEHDGISNLLFNMEDIKLDIGKLAIWRLQTHSNFGGTWLSDYLPNRLGVEIGAFLEEDQPDHKTPAAVEIKNYTLRARFHKDGDEEGGLWQGFPTTQEELTETLKRIGVYSGDIIASQYSSDIHFLSDCLDAIMEPDNLDLLNYLAVKLEELTETQVETLEAVLESRKHCESVESIINIIENLRCFELQPAFNAKQYGDFLLEMIGDDTSEVFLKLEKSENEAERAIAQHLLRLEKLIDHAAYGRSVAEEEKGVFTTHGYLTENEGFTQFFVWQRDIPPEYRIFAYPEPDPPMKVTNADLPTLLLEMHALGSAYMADIKYNVDILINRSGSEYLLLMTGNNVFLTETKQAYIGGTSANEIWKGTAESSATKAFAFHVTDQYGGNIIGDVIEMDFKKLKADIQQNSIYHTAVNAKMKDGTTKTLSGIQWDSMGLIERDRVQSFTFQYDPESLRSVVKHIEKIRMEHQNIVQSVQPAFLLSEINAHFMSKAVAPQPDMLRLDNIAAKEVLARNDVPVYSLLPTGPKLLTQLDAVKINTHISYYPEQQFGIKKEDVIRIDKWAKREVTALEVKRQQEIERNSDGIDRDEARKSGRDKPKRQTPEQ